MRRVTRLATDVGPAGLVPAAWVLTGAAVYTPLVTDRTLLIALLVMDILLAAFFLGTRDAMTGPVLGAWRGVLAGGLAANLVGTVALLVAPAVRAPLAVSLFAWMVLPGLAYVRTWRAVGASLPGRLYLLSAVGSLAGTALFALGTVASGPATAAGPAGLVAVGLGQTVGIVTAALRNVAS